MKKMFGFIKRNSKSARLFVASMMISIIASLSAICASAEETTVDLESAFSTALANIQSDILGYIAIALPVGLTIFGAIIAIKKGVSFVRGLIGKS